jgi:hypothetical protein
MILLVILRPDFLEENLLVVRDVDNHLREFRALYIFRFIVFNSNHHRKGSAGIILSSDSSNPNLMHVIEPDGFYFQSDLHQRRLIGV